MTGLVDDAFRSLSEHLRAAETLYQCLVVTMRSSSLKEIETLSVYPTVLRDCLPTVSNAVAKSTR